MQLLLHDYKLNVVIYLLLLLLLYLRASNLITNKYTRNIVDLLLY